MATAGTSALLASPGGVARRVKLGGGPSWSTPGGQLTFMFIFAAVLFLGGIFAGSYYFEHSAHWSDLAKTSPLKSYIRVNKPVSPVVAPIVRAGNGANHGASPAPSPLSSADIGGKDGPGAADDGAPPVPTVSDIVASGLTWYGVFTGRTVVAVSKALDSRRVSFGAWIYLDGQDKGANIKTIASTRAGGCTVDDAHRGWSFYVNQWASNDRSLVLEWRNSGGSGGGCAQLASEPNTIPYDTWVHVGFALDTGTEDESDGPTTLLFMNGELLRAARTSRRDVDVQVDGKGDARLVVGATADKQFYFHGRIGQVFVASTIVTPKQLVATARLVDPEGWQQLALHGKGKVSLLLSFTSTGFHDPVVPPVEGSTPPVVTTLHNGLAVAEFVGVATVLGGVTPLVPASPEPRSTINYAELSPEDAVPDSIKRTSVPGKSPATARAKFEEGGNQWIRHMIRVPPEQGSGAVTDPAALASGKFSDDVTAEQLAASDELGRTRAAAVKAAMQHAWRGYVQHAWGADELKPRSGTRSDNWAGVGMTLVDSLDTLWLLGMKDEFAEARQWVANSLNYDKHAAISVFEITIRELGGLLAAYDLSGDRVFLDKAKELGDRLLPAFNTPTGIPRSTITLANGMSSMAGWTGGGAILSELGTLQVEFRYLSRATGDGRYATAVERVIDRMDSIHPTDGLFPIFISPDSGTPTTSQVTFGALGDSFYEYLLKVWVQGGRSEARYRRMYDEAMRGMTNKLLKRSSPSGLAYVADWNGAATHDKMDHLVCFVPGMLALGAFNSKGTPGEAQAVRDLINAKAVMYTCWQMYDRQATGIAPEYVEFPGGRDLEVAGGAPFYILRPEAAESLFILHQLTGNPIYREWGWKMFQSIERYCKVEYGYGAHPDVRDPSRTPDDRMESFFLAETLKYLYLLQSPDHPISLEQYVFNTEAHPTRIFPMLAAAGGGKGVA